MPLLSTTASARCLLSLEPNNQDLLMALNASDMTIMKSEGKDCAQDVKRRWLGSRKDQGESSPIWAPGQAWHSNRIGTSRNRHTSSYAKQYFEAGWAKIMAMKYLVIVEKSENGFSAYVPDLPGCVSAAESRDEIVTLIQESIEFHIEGLKESGEPVPEPSSQSELVDVRAA